MFTQIDNTTPALAVLYGLLVVAAKTRTEAGGALDAKTTRELAVLARVLEKRLGEARESIATG